MNLFMYLPSEDPALVSPAYMFRDRIKQLKRATYKKAYVIRKEDLGYVEPGDALYISGHGAAGDERIHGTVGQSIDAVELAGQFKGKLNALHERIKVWVCFSGDGMTEGRGLAFKFWLAMNPSFKLLSVYGYRFAVQDPFRSTQEHLYAAIPLPGFVSITETPKLLDYLPGTTQHWRTGIRPDGSIIPPKPLPRDEPPLSGDSD